MLFAQEAAQKTSNFTGFDIFMILFTIVIAIGFIRSLMAPQKNWLAVVFSGVALLVFLFMDYWMVMNWLGLMNQA